MADSTIAITPGTGVSVRTITNAGVDGGAHQQVFTLADAAGNTLGTDVAPLPITIAGAGGLATASGSLTAAVANTPGTAVTASTSAQIVANVASAGNVTFHLVATAFVGTVVFEGSVDAGLNYAPIMAIREDGTGAENTTAISTAAAFIRLYTAALPGLTYFRVRCSSFTSGSLAVILAPGPTLFEPNPTLAAGVATIGTVNVTPATLVVTATGAANAIVTATLPAAGAGLYHYISSVQIQKFMTTAGTGAGTAVLTSGANHSLVWNQPTDAALIGTSQMVVDYRPTTPLRSTAANTATTFITAAVAATIYRINVTYYTGI